MSKCCIEPDWTSYIHMISGYSRVHNLYDSLRLYDEMKRRGWAPGLEVYHSLIYVLTHENCLTEALKLVDRMKESGPVPDSTTYNLIIRPLCENARFEDARSVLARMLGDGISPTIDTYHELLKGENSEGALGVLDRMNKAGLGPNHDTFTCMLDEYFKSGEPDDALKIWSAMKMKSSGLENDLSLRKLVEQPSPGQCKGKMKLSPFIVCQKESVWKASDCKMEVTMSQATRSCSDLT
ncbi:hypothetical protein SASPL_120462 [Salvia splendens]|uniref:Pentatricopeptide repeat domain-containing protein 1 n=1 Tax=Salvia splendens TaxID=180675 RepID=A0A8X8XVI1_SALSN|nr:hypothetical protein SASPL_120462 [Salvia splendens]